MAVVCQPCLHSTVFCLSRISIRNHPVLLLRVMAFVMYDVPFAPNERSGCNSERNKRTVRTVHCTPRAPRARFWFAFYAFLSFFQGGRDAAA